MLKLMKYELKKSKLFFLVTFAIIAITELLFLIGYYGEHENLFVTSLILAVLIFIGGFFAAMLFSTLLYYNDVSKKPGYLLFMTPRSTGQIVLAKLLVSFLGLIILLLLEGAFMIPNIAILIGDLEEGSLMDVIISPLLDAMEGNWGYLLLLLANMIFGWYSSIIAIFAAIALSKTLLGNQKIGPLIAFLFWCGINTIESLISYVGTLLFGDFLSPSMEMNVEATTASEAISIVADFTAAPLVFSLILTLLFCAALHVLTVWLTDKKMSL